MEGIGDMFDGFAHIDNSEEKAKVGAIDVIEYNLKEFDKCTKDGHKTHYIKWTLNKLNKDLSIRFFFTFDDKKEYEGKYMMKSHKDKKFTEVNEIFAKYMVEKYCTKKAKEIIGLLHKGCGYRKMIIKNGKLYINKEK